VESLVARGQEALDTLNPRQLILAPDCGMVQISREAAKAKLVNLAKATAILNGH
jgi:5-methyltetrahydropteroyltriglutamate--homocysteine methyltransferase